tara:strand:- start:596 stop:1075 length:480 start_codon:yes stop_codon:yes gene_type:complete
VIANWPAERKRQLGAFLLWVRDECGPKTAAALLADADREAHVSVNHDDERAVGALCALEAMDEDWEAFAAGCRRLVPTARKLRVLHDMQFVRGGQAGQYNLVKAGTVVQQVSAAELIPFERSAYLRAQKRDLPKLLLPFQCNGNIHWGYLGEDLEAVGG